MGMVELSKLEPFMPEIKQYSRSADIKQKGSYS